METSRGKLTDRPWRALQLATGLASAQNHVLVTPTVALAGVAAEGECLAAKALASAGITPAAIVETTRKLPDRSGEPEWGPSLCAVVDAADRISGDLGLPYTDAEHLTLALLAEASVSSVVVRLGADLDALRSAVHALV